MSYSSFALVDDSETFMDVMKRSLIVGGSAGLLSFALSGMDMKTSFLLAPFGQNLGYVNSHIFYGLTSFAGSLASEGVHRLLYDKFFDGNMAHKAAYMTNLAGAGIFTLGAMYVSNDQLLREIGMVKPIVYSVGGQAAGTYGSVILRNMGIL